MSNLNLQKLRDWVWPWPWTFKCNGCQRKLICKQALLHTCHLADLWSRFQRSVPPYGPYGLQKTLCVFYNLPNTEIGKDVTAHLLHTWWPTHRLPCTSRRRRLRALMEYLMFRKKTPTYILVRPKAIACGADLSFTSDVFYLFFFSTREISEMRGPTAVSYTHLTLPTNREV